MVVHGKDTPLFAAMADKHASSKTILELRERTPPETYREPVRTSVVVFNRAVGGLTEGGKQNQDGVGIFACLDSKMSACEPNSLS